MKPMQAEMYTTSYELHRLYYKTADEARTKAITEVEHLERELAQARAAL
jgi:hypothetical protein